MAAFKGRNRVLCRVAAEALCRIGSAAIPALQAARGDPTCRASVKWALSKIGDSDEAPETIVHVKQRTAPAIAMPTASVTPELADPVARSGVERRTDPRYPCNREVFYELVTRKGQDLWWNAAIIDVSSGGIGLMLTPPGEPQVIALPWTCVRRTRASSAMPWLASFTPVRFPAAG